MADWSALTSGFTGGYEFGTKARRHRQAEKYNDMVLKEMRRSSFDKDVGQRDVAAKLLREEGVKMPQFQDSGEGFEDPYLLRFGNWMKGKMGGRKKQALDLEGSFGSELGSIENPMMGTRAAREGMMGDFQDMTGDLLGGQRPPEYEPDPNDFADGGLAGYQDGGIPLTPEQIEEIERLRIRRAATPGAPEQLFRGDIEPESPRNPHVGEGDRPRARTGTGQNPFAGEVPPSEEQMIDDQVKRQRAAEKAFAAEKAAAERAAAAEAAEAAGEGKGFVRRGIAAARGSKITPLVLAAEAGNMAFTDTEDYRKRFTGKGLPEGDNTLAGDVGWRLAGGIDDLLLTMPSHVWRAFMDENAPVKGGGGAGRGHGASGTWGEPDKKAIPADKDGKVELGTTLVAGKPIPLDVAEIDIDYRDMPNMETEDWSKHRLYAMAHAGRMGMDPAAAYEYASDQVTRTQIKGFTNFAQQGLMLMEAGNSKAAMRAFYAAFQYFPNGRNVKFGMHNGKMYGIGYDEKTGEREGPPMLMDPVKLSTMIEQFSNPKALREFTKDQQDFQQKLVEWHEKEKPLAQSTADLQAAQAYQATQVGNYYGAGGASGAAGAGGLKQADLRASQDKFAEIFMMAGITDQTVLRGLVKRGMEVKRRNPQTDETAIADELYNAATGKPLPQRTAIPAGAAAAPGRDVTQAPVDDVRAPVTEPARVAAPAPIDRGRPAAIEQPAPRTALDGGGDDLLPFERPGARPNLDRWAAAHGRDYAIEGAEGGDFDENAPAMTLEQYRRTHNGMTPEQFRAAMSRPAQ